ncbi:MAG: type II toxin-antitoxin system Phd/YefM family antitoxin [Alphaproteobacteria bacterium]|jgi:prevent-host-death family protein|nr:MAG: type II toxin-antitoxin system Phd/YefM family antitoxin [Alphaproteobacteria bacterium]
MTMQDWNLSEAKNKLSEVMNNALLLGPQVIHRRNDVVIMLSKQEYDRLMGHTSSFKEMLLSPPHDLGELEHVRDNSLMRDSGI